MYDYLKGKEGKVVRWHSCSNPYDAGNYGSLGSTGLQRILYGPSGEPKKSTGLQRILSGGATEEEKQDRLKSARDFVASGYALPKETPEVETKAQAGLKKYPILRVLGAKSFAEMQEMNALKKSSAQLLEMEDFMKAIAATTKGLGAKAKKERRLVAAVNLKLLAEMKATKEEDAAKDLVAKEQGFASWEEAEAINMVKLEWYSKIYNLLQADGGSILDALKIASLEAAEEQVFGLTSYNAQISRQTPQLLTPDQVAQVLAGEQLRLEEAKQQVVQHEKKQALNRNLMVGAAVVGVPLLGFIIYRMTR